MHKKFFGREKIGFLKKKRPFFWAFFQFEGGIKKTFPLVRMATQSADRPPGWIGITVYPILPTLQVSSPYDKKKLDEYRNIPPPPEMGPIWERREGV